MHDSEYTRLRYRFLVATNVSVSVSIYNNILCDLKGQLYMRVI